MAAVIFFLPAASTRVASSLKSMQIFHEALFAVRAFANHREKKHPSGQPLFPPPSSRRGLFFILSTLPDVAVRETNFITGDTTAKPLSRIRRF